MPRGDKNIKAGPGRPKGSKDKLPRDMKNKVLAIAEKLEAEGKGLEDEARKDPPWFYVNFVKPMLPKDVQVQGDLGLNIIIQRFSESK